MARIGDMARKTASLGIPVLMLTLSVAVPLLERADLVAEPVVESEHHPDTCPRSHDHTVCAQVGASFSAPAVIGQDGQARVVVRVGPRTEAPRLAAAAFPEGHPSRAPPLI